MFAILSLLLASQVSMARILPDDEAVAVMNAVVDASKESNLTCSFMNAKGVVNDTKPILEAFTWDAFYLSEETQTQMSVNEEVESPVITIKRKIPGATFVEETQVTLNSDMTKVTRFNYRSFGIKEVSKNVGTILKPKYEQVRTLALESETNCQ